VRDVVLAHPQRALEDQRLEHRGVEPAVGVGLVGQRGGDGLRIAQGELQRAPVMGVEVAHAHAVAGGGRLEL
jgi:hypothetical protein